MNGRIGTDRDRNTVAVLCVLFALHSGAGQAAAQDAATSGDQPVATVADLQWIAGSWSVRSGEQTIEEHWVAASNTLLGMGRTLSGDRMIAFEYLRIESRPEGVFYVAQPSGRPPTAFRLTKWDGRQAVFENPAHDFPRRVIYSRTGENELTAWVDGGEGSSNALSFTYTRVAR